MRKKVRTRHGDRVKYAACVLWLIGHSERAIAAVLGLRTKQVAGIIGRSEYAGRAFMPEEIRTEKLKELQDIRFEDGKALDGGLLDNVEFAILPGSSRLRPGPLRRRM